MDALKTLEEIYIMVYNLQLLKLITKFQTRRSMLVRTMVQMSLPKTEELLLSSSTNWMKLYIYCQELMPTLLHN